MSVVELWGSLERRITVITAVYSVAIAVCMLKFLQPLGLCGRGEGVRVVELWGSLERRITVTAVYGVAIAVCMFLQPLG